MPPDPDSMEAKDAKDVRPPAGRGRMSPALMVGFALVLAALCGNALVSSSNMDTVARNRAAVEHTHEVEADAEAVLSTLKDAETGQRGFLLTRRGDYLGPYTLATGLVHSQIAKLEATTRGDVEQQRRVVELRRLVAAKLTELQRTIRMQQAGDDAGARRVLMSGRGRAYMDEIRGVVGQIIAAERLLLAQREHESEVSEREMRVTFVGATAGSLALLAVVYALSYRDAARRRAAQEQHERHLADVETLNRRLRRAMTETHHRVKNNLQIISAMVDLHAEEGDGTLSAEEVTQLAGNIRALAAVQDVLTQEARSRGDAREVSTKELIEKLLSIHQQSAPTHAITADVEDVRLPGKQGTALALLANELLSNAVKHGRSAVDLRLRSDAAAGTLDLTVRDDGPGFPAGFDPEQAANTGLELVSSLARWDLGGELVFGNAAAAGGEVRLRMPLPEPAAYPEPTAPSGAASG